MKTTRVVALSPSEWIIFCEKSYMYFHQVIGSCYAIHQIYIRMTIINHFA